MYTTMRYIAAGIQESPDYSGEVRLFVASRAQENIYAVSEQGLAHSTYSDEVLYVIDWATLQSSLFRQLPQNILCVNAPVLERPAVPANHNLIVLDSAVSTDTLRSIIDRYNADQQSQTSFAPQLLESLYSGSLEKLCRTTAALCGNPVLFLNFNFRVIESALLDTEQSAFIQMAESRSLGSELVHFLHDKRNLPHVNTGEILRLPESDLRFLCIPIQQSGIHIASILLLEDRVRLSEQDRLLLNHVAKCFRLLQPELSAGGPTRLIYEYVLIRALGDEFAEENSYATRFNSVGYTFKQNLYMLVINSTVQISVDNLRQQMSTLTNHVRRIVGDYGLCTTFRDHIVVLLNLDNDNPLPKIISDFTLFCKRNNLYLGISPKFSDSNELKRYYRYALDAIGLGTLINSHDVVFNFDDLRIYKFVANCARSFSPIDLVPEYLSKLIESDRENNSELLETLYYYVYTIKNTKKAAELMHIHRNTLLYRLEKIRSIIGTDPEEDGDAFLRLMLSFKFLEFHALQEGRELCFKTIRPDTPFKSEESGPPV